MRMHNVPVLIAFLGGLVVLRVGHDLGPPPAVTEAMIEVLQATCRRQSKLSRRLVRSYLPQFQHRNRALTPLARTLRVQPARIDVRVFAIP